VLKQHAISNEMFAALARGRGGASAGAWLTLAERSKHLVLLQGVVRTAELVAHPRAGEIRSAYRLLCLLNERIADPVDRTVRQPSVGAWALDAIQRMRGSELPAHLPERINALAAAAAIRGRFPHVTTVAVIGGTVVLPSVGLASLRHCGRDATATVRVTASSAEVSAAGSRVRIPADLSSDADGWQGLRAITADSGGVRLRLVIDDVDPYRFSLHSGLGARLGAAEAEHWSAAIRDAWQLLVRYHGPVADEVRTIVTTLTPLRTQSQSQSNATSRTTFGCVALSCPDDGASLALSLAHEVQHAKLAALLDLVELVRPGAAGLHYAPWRDDPRPAGALLHGTYAHLGVADFWRRQRHTDSNRSGLVSHREFARWRAATAEAADCLRSCADLTALGHLFVAGIESTLRSWRHDRVPAEAADLAWVMAEDHRSRWLGAYGD
jgi:HEXXH motif-containing protein